VDELTLRFLQFNLKDKDELKGGIVTGERRRRGRGGGNRHWLFKFESQNDCYKLQHIVSLKLLRTVLLKT